MKKRKHTFSLVGTVYLYSSAQGGIKHLENNDSISDGERAPSRSRSCCINNNVKNSCPLCDNSVVHPTGTFNLYNISKVNIKISKKNI